MGDFKKFLLRGNVVDLAVAVAIGAVFGQVVSAFVADILTPLIGLVVPGSGFFGDRALHVNLGSRNAEFRYGHLANTIIYFVIVSAAVFFFVVKPINRLTSIRRSGTDTERLNTECPECLSSVPLEAKRCAFCTSRLDLGDEEPVLYERDRMSQ